MKKYRPLYDHLMSRRDANTKPDATVTLRFTEIETILGAPLPPSAFTYQAWWANETNPVTHVQKHSWTRAGFRVEQVQQSGADSFVKFRRVRS